MGLCACVDNRPMVGMLTVNESKVLYAGGPFGEITELYIFPAYRSSGIGGGLMDPPATFGHDRS